MPEIENWEQYSELEAMYEKARERLSGDGTLGSHYLLTSYLLERYGVTALKPEKDNAICPALKTTAAAVEITPAHKRRPSPFAAIAARSRFVVPKTGSDPTAAETTPVA